MGNEPRFLGEKPDPESFRERVAKQLEPGQKPWPSTTFVLWTIIGAQVLFFLYVTFYM